MKKELFIIQYKARDHAIKQMRVKKYGELAPSELKKPHMMDTVGYVNVEAFFKTEGGKKHVKEILKEHLLIIED